MGIVFLISKQRTNYMINTVVNESARVIIVANVNQVPGFSLLSISGIFEYMDDEQTTLKSSTSRPVKT